MSEVVVFEEVSGALAVNCSELSLRAAMTKLGPAFGYDLHVSKLEYLDEIVRMRQLTAAPLAFQINVHCNPDLDIDAWYLELGDRKVGSRGCR